MTDHSLRVKSVTYRHGKFELHVRPAGDDCVEVVLPQPAEPAAEKSLAEILSDALAVDEISTADCEAGANAVRDEVLKRLGEEGIRKCVTDAALGKITEAEKERDDYARERDAYMKLYNKACELKDAMTNTANRHLLELTQAQKRVAELEAEKEQWEPQWNSIAAANADVYNEAAANYDAKLLVAQKRVAELEAELAKLRLEANAALRCEPISTIQRIADLEAELAKRQADARYLDHIEANGGTLTQRQSRMQWPDGSETKNVWQYSGNDIKILTSKTARDAIQQHMETTDTVADFIEPARLDANWRGPQKTPVADPALIEQVLSSKDDKMHNGQLCDTIDHLNRELEAEKQRRVYYQDIVYFVCNTIDRINHKKPGSEVVCSTAASPTRQVQTAMNQIALKLAMAHLLPAESDAALDNMGPIPSIESCEYAPQCVDLAERPIVLTKDQSRDLDKINGVCRDCDGNELKVGDVVKCVDVEYHCRVLQLNHEYRVNAFDLKGRVIVDDDPRHGRKGKLFRRVDPPKEQPTTHCIFDTNSDGDCQHCSRRGGCKAIGGPFKTYREIDERVNVAPPTEQPAVTTKWEGAKELHSQPQADSAMTDLRDKSVPPPLVPWSSPADVPSPCWLKPKTDCDVYLATHWSMFGNGGRGQSWKALFEYYEWSPSPAGPFKPCGKVGV